MYGKINQIELLPEREPIELSTQDGFQIAATAIGYGGELLRLWVPREAVDEIFGRVVKPNFASFPVTQANQSYTARLAISTSYSEMVCDFAGMTTSCPMIQLLPKDRVVVAGARCTRSPAGEVELNARVYRFDGAMESEFCLGDGVEHLQADKAGRLWVGYCDEGVYGNFGWGNHPMGWAGLASFDSFGNHLWDFIPPGGFDVISDCYALNVSDDAVWACYYTDFPIVRVDSNGKAAGWTTPLRGPSAISVSGNLVLAFGGYREHRSNCSLLHLGEGTAEVMAQVRLMLPDGVDLEECKVIGRGSMLHVISDDYWLTFRVPDRV